jgi:tripartite-type tricarboxylate transporter receptor subunit TctC
VGFPPGGGAGISAQIFAESAKNYLPKPQPVIINYKPGASSAIAADFVLKQPADGYNLFWGSPDLTMKMAKEGDLLPFKNEDFVFIGLIATSPYLLTVNKESPFKSIEDFLDYAKKNPGKLAYGSSGIGTGTHVHFESIQMRCGIKLNHIPFAGGAAVIAALLGGHIDCSNLNFPNLGDHIRPGGGLRTLVVFDRERFHELPDVPTCMERGYNDILLRSTWFYLASPKKIPQPVLDILWKVFKKTADDPKVKEALLRMGYVPQNLGPEETEKRVNKEFDIAREIFKKVGLLR